MKFAITKENSIDLGLPISAAGIAITGDECKAWLIFIIDNTDIEVLPSYVADLLDSQEYGGVYEMMKPFGRIGFQLNPSLDEQRYNSLWAIGYARKDPSFPIIRTDFEQNVVSRKDAEKALARHPEIHAWFVRFFTAIGKPDELPPLKDG